MNELTQTPVLLQKHCQLAGIAASLQLPLKRSSRSLGQCGACLERRSGHSCRPLPAGWLLLLFHDSCMRGPHT